MTRRPIVAVVGNNACGQDVLRVAEELGRRLIDAGFRLATGGLGGVMEAASRGARASARHREGDVIGILPGPAADAANEYVDIALPTNLGYARNVLLVNVASAIVAVGGGAGTLTEIAMAWQLDKPIVALDVEGWSSRLAGSAIDARPRPPILRATSPEAAVQELLEILRVGSN